jgi:putative PIN family toxin of toxin-antitoxin system
VATEKIRVVFDCNIYLQAFISSRSPAATCLGLARDGAIVSFISRPTLAELKDVLQRPFVARKLPHVTPALIQAFLDDISASAMPVRRIPAKFQLERDPKDTPYINLAVAAQADYIVTRDKDLLDLMTGHTDECKEFRQRFRPLKVIDPVGFLHALLLT